MLNNKQWKRSIVHHTTTIKFSNETSINQLGKLSEKNSRERETSKLYNQGHGRMTCIIGILFRRNLCGFRKSEINQEIFLKINQLENANVAELDQ